MLEFLQHTVKDEGGWSGWWSGYGQWCWGCAEPGWKRVVKSHEGWDLCLCGVGGGVDGSGGCGGVDGSSESSVVDDSGGSIVYRRGGGGLYRGGWYFGVGWDFYGGGGGRSGTGGGMCCEASPVLCE